MISWYKNLPIRLKLISIILSVVLTVLLSSSIFLYIYIIKSVEENMMSQARLNMKIFSELIIPYIVFDTPDEALNSLSKLENVKNVMHADVYDKDKKLFVAFGEAFHTKDFKISDREVIHRGMNFIEFSDSIKNEGEIIGYISMKFSTEEIYEFERFFSIALLTALAILMFLAFIFADKLQRLISVPIIKLAQAMKDIASGVSALDIKLSKYANDELGSLYDGFNNMMDQLKLRDKARDRAQEELEHLNKTLEKRVFNRTHELQTSLNTLKETQKQVIEAEKMASLGELVAGVAHEINTPLGISVTGITHLKDMSDNIKKLYDENNMSKRKFEDYLEVNVELTHSISINLQRAAELVRSFKMVAVDQSSEQMVKFELRDRIDQIIVSLRNKIKHTKIKLKVDCDKNIEMYGEPGAIAQIFTNLITNSILHGFDKDDEGIIDIIVREQNDKIQIIYKDNGKGIKADVLPKIFDPFFTTIRANGGTGLGLHIIYNLVTSKFGGKIEAHSVFGEGVEFKITLNKKAEKPRN